MSTRVFSVSLGGFDFHADEKVAQERLLGRARHGGDRLRRPDGQHRSAAGQVVMLVYSEFGRRVRANASDGTDHGTASNVFLARTPAWPAVG